MSISGSIIESGGKVLYVFGTSKVASWSPDIPDMYHIGINLDTGKVDDIKSNHPHDVKFHQLSDEQQSVLGVNIPVYHLLKKRVMTVSAKARSGKDYLANAVCRNFPDTQVISLADPIREVRNLLLGEPKDKDRAPLIMIGQGLRREDPNIWIKVWLGRAIEKLRNNANCRLVCADVRQPNEFTFFESLGAMTVKIETDENLRLNKIREIDGEAAVSEVLLKDETESHVGGFKASFKVFNDYSQIFNEEIQEVVSILYERGW